MSETPVEVRYKGGAIDEICAHGCNLHIEQMTNDGWFIGIDGADGSYWQFWLGAKNRKSHVEVRHTEHVTKAEQDTWRDSSRAAISRTAEE
jgi:hypothetical protein